MSWRERAACRGCDSDLFFVASRGNYRDGKAVCATCTVTEDCLNWALTNRVTCGLYGGLSPAERSRVRRRPPRPLGSPP